MINQLEAQSVFTHEEGATYWTGEWAPQLLGKQQQRPRTQQPTRRYMVHSPSLQRMSYLSMLTYYIKVTSINILLAYSKTLKFLNLLHLPSMLQYSHSTLYLA